MTAADLTPDTVRVLREIKRREEIHAVALALKLEKLAARTNRRRVSRPERVEPAESDERVYYNPYTGQRWRGGRS
jgi:hypothetical protein